MKTKSQKEMVVELVNQLILETKMWLIEDAQSPEELVVLPGRLCDLDNLQNELHKNLKKHRSQKIFWIIVEAIIRLVVNVITEKITSPYKFRFWVWMFQPIPNV